MLLPIKTNPNIYLSFFHSTSCFVNLFKIYIFGYCVLRLSVYGKLVDTMKYATVELGEVSLEEYSIIPINYTAYTFIKFLILLKEPYFMGIGTI